MTRKQRRVGPTDEDSTPAVVPEGDRPVLRPVRKKIGEGGTNLRDRQAFLGRRKRSR
jgi:hypothetical protein